MEYYFIKINLMTEKNRIYCMTIKNRIFNNNNPILKKIDILTNII